MEKMQMQQRNYGIDLLKILSMFMVVVLHVLGKGGPLYGTVKGSAQYWSVWFLEIAAYCAVNCFALSTGYLMGEKKFSGKKIAPLWVTVFFYCVVLELAGALLWPDDWSVKQLAYIFPVFSGKYWYFSAYFCMYFFIPLLNLAVEKMPERDFRRLLIAGFLLLSGSMVIRSNLDSLKQENGYNAWWLGYLYLLGAGIKKYGYFQNISGKKAIFGYFSAVFLTFLSKFAMEWLQGAKIPVLTGAANFYNPQRFVNYISPTIVASAVFLMTACIKAKPPKWLSRVLKWMSPLVFQVYIIHEHPTVRDHFVKGILADYVTVSAPALLGLALLTALGIFAACIGIDTLRSGLFWLLKVDQFVNKLVDRISMTINKLFKATVSD